MHPSLTVLLSVIIIHLTQQGRKDKDAISLPDCILMKKSKCQPNPLGQKISLTSGKSCHLMPIRDDLIRNYYLLAFPIEQGQPSFPEVTEMLNVGISYAQQLAEESLNDSEAFTILYSGYSARREKGWHVHIVLLGSRWRKAWLYAVLAGKNFLQALGLRKDDAPRLT